MKDLNSYYLKLTALSPIHIGTGESYEPTNFVIDNGMLYEFDEVLFYKSLSDVDKKAINNKMGSWLQIIEFYKTKKEQAKEISFFECRVSKEVQKKYDAKNPNQLQINRTFKNPNTHRAVIAGSSIKGMLDTVLHIYSQPEVSSNEERQKLIVSDALLLNGAVEIGFSNRKHRHKEKAGKGIPQMVEVIQPTSTFVLTISTKYSFEQIQDLMKKYHSDRQNSRYRETENSFIARIGKYCGKEYMVYNGKNVKNKNGHPLATHSLYSSDRLKDKMFGWVKFELISQEIYQNSLEDIQTQEQTYYQNRDTKQAKVLNAIKKVEDEAKEKALQKQKEAEEAKRKAAEEEARHQAELAAMSPLERKIEELKSAHPNPNDTEDVIVFQNIKNGNLDEYKCEALEQLEKLMRENGKWNENKPKKKTYARTMEVIEMQKECN